MALNVNRLETKILDEIKSNHFSEAIDLLTENINKITDNYCKEFKVDGVETRFRYYLLRSYCKYKSGSDDELLNTALEDVFYAIDLNENRFQPYLLGLQNTPQICVNRALIFLDMKRWQNSLNMFEKSIEIKSDLLTIFVNKLIYLKFKILSHIHGVNEEISLNCALNYRSLDDCLENIVTTSEECDSTVLQFIITSNNTPKVCTDISLKDLLIDLNKVKTKNSIIIGSNDNQIIFKPFDEYSDRWRRPYSDDDFSSGDRQLIHDLIQKQNNQITDRLLNESLKSEAIEVNDNSLNSITEEILFIEREEEESKSESVQNWIKSNFLKDSASKLCSFDQKREEEEEFFPTKSVITSKRTNSLSLSETQNINFDILSIKSHRSSVVPQFQESATNLLKLRGVYIGNLKPKCDQKVLKKLFGKYGTIVDIYQPSGEGYGFIHYNTYESALQMLNDWKNKPMDECKQNARLVVRFTPSQEQMQKYNTMSFTDYKKRCNEGQECELWRSGKRCPNNNNCPFKHIDINRAVDTLPERRKAHWKCH